MSYQYHDLKVLPSLFLAHTIFFLYKCFPQQISFLSNPIYPILTSSQRTQSLHVVHPHSILIFSIIVIFLLSLPLKAPSLPDLSLFLIPSFSSKYVSRFLSHAEQICLFTFSYTYQIQVLKSKFLPFCLGLSNHLPKRSRVLHWGWFPYMLLSNYDWLNYIVYIKYLEINLQRYCKSYL